MHSARHAAIYRIVQFAGTCASFRDGLLETPSVGTVPNLTETGRISVCTRVLFRETLFCWMNQGKEGVDKVEKLVLAMEARFGNYDALDMTSVGIPVVKEYLRIVMCIKSLANFSLGLAHKDTFHW